MQIFSCPACRAPVYFHNLTCGCGHLIAYSPRAGRMVSLMQGCENRTSLSCNWEREGAGPRCQSCAMTRTVPDTHVTGNHLKWAQTEAAKRWVLVGLMQLGWLTDADTGPRPVFDLHAEATASGAALVTMGHHQGAITLNIAEADRAEAERRRADLDEPYRALAGHLRHELAHYLHWRLLAGEAGFAGAFRAVFGDERADYAGALQRHYAHPQPAGAQFLTSYASAHPHEDWAETVASLLHLYDICDSFAATGLHLGPVRAPDPKTGRTGALITRAVDIGLALNHVNRGMGLGDLYPFVLSRQVREKMRFADGYIARVPGMTAAVV